jgi:DNA polymerase III subunit epsilon
LPWVLGWATERRGSWVVKMDCDFFALDVETANPDRSSVCSIGLVGFKDGEVAVRWSSLIDPKDYFHPYCIFIHGITPNMVEGAPELSEVVDELSGVLNGKVVASHSPFDHGAIRDYCRRRGLEEPACSWLDTVRVARRTWPDFKKNGGYGLLNLCESLNIPLQHHEAESDAEACGRILLQACVDKGMNIDEWPVVASRPISGQWPSDSRYRRKGGPVGPLKGEVFCFTGTLQSMGRMEAADRVAELGAEVANNLTRKVTILVLGEQVVLSYRGKKVSRKMEQAYGRLKKGDSIQIVTEQDFIRLSTADAEPS